MLRLQVPRFESKSLNETKKPQSFQQWVVATENAKVKPKEIKIEDLVRWIFEVKPRKPTHVVLRVNWEGPYILRFT